MARRVHSHLHMQPQTPTWALNYHECTTEELRKFLEERTGTTLTEGQLQKIKDHDSYPLIDRLRQMDREATFPRSMELAPELRLGIYEALLIATKTAHKHDEVSALHPAVLRTSKQVYSEAVPILYKKNKFRAEVAYAERSSWSRISGTKPVCSLMVRRSGGGCPFQYRMETGAVSLMRSLFNNSATMHMLRMLTHLTIDIDLMAPQGRSDRLEYFDLTCYTMRGLCLSLGGASKMKELTVRVKSGDQDSSDIDLAGILWPLLFLREDVEVKFKGITASPEKMLTENGKILEVVAAFGRQIAHVKRLGITELERPDWENRCWEFHGMRDAERALYALKPLGKQLLCLDDIVNMSPVWEGMRREIDYVEANSEQ